MRSFRLPLCLHISGTLEGLPAGRPLGFFPKLSVSLLVLSLRVWSENSAWARRAMLPSSCRSPLGSHFLSSALQLLQDAPQASPGSMEAWQDGKSCLPPLNTQATHRAFQFGDSPTSHLLFKLPQELLKPRYFSFLFLSYIYSGSIWRHVRAHFPASLRDI